ncbi:ribonuclease H family protein [Lactobacillus sp. S2-2]|uniref:ribonuclease H family protein n=1 Tax=Lactobacillus sp. S2-2 TaxID=2692917 RepID=UPI001F44CC81|nr:ribonuclease H family protein [Lactobacillus sp. S2-2]
MTEQKFYAVKKGRKIGVFRTWAECQKQVQGFSGAKFKSFTSETEAKTYINEKAISQSESKVNGEINSKNSSKPNIIVFTDGGSRNHGNTAGNHVKENDKAAWAYLINGQTGQHSDSGGEYGATNNRMEIMAFIESLQWLSEKHLENESIGFISDSKYVLNAIQKGWIKGWKKRGWKRSAGELKNAELWKQLDQLLQLFTNLQFAWTKGHANNKGNIFVDELLNKTMDEMN